MTQQSDTPETDARVIEMTYRYANLYPHLCNAVDSDFARKLERERDEARKQLEPRNGHTFELVTKMWEDTHIELANAISERDQLRKVADELALVIKTCNAHGYGLKIGDEVLDTYNQLSHVKQKEQS